MRKARGTSASILLAGRTAGGFELSEDERGMRGLIGAWLEFATLRKEMETRIHDLELTNFNLTYSARTEAEFRQKLKEIRSCLDKIDVLIGAPKEAPNNVA
jgi:hypothetical protein